MDGATRATEDRAVAGIFTLSVMSRLSMVGGGVTAV
jgi:hypothetical protein